jgi:hypothetical protein
MLEKYVEIQKLSRNPLSNQGLDELKKFIIDGLSSQEIILLLRANDNNFIIVDDVETSNSISIFKLWGVGTFVLLLMFLFIGESDLFNAIRLSLINSI